jgi:hypothetical protein
MLPVRGVRSKVGTTLAFAAGCAEPRFGKYDLVLQFYNGNLQLVFVHICILSSFQHPHPHDRVWSLRGSPSPDHLPSDPVSDSSLSLSLHSCLHFCCVVRLCPSVVARARPQPARPRPSSRVGAHVAQRSACTPPSPPTPGSLYFQTTWLLCSLYLSISIYHRRLKQTRRGIGNVGNIQCGISSISIPRRSTAQHTARYDAQHLHHRLHRN